MKKGFSFLEIVIVIFIFSILLIPTTFVILNYQKNLSLESAVSEIVEVLDYARNCAKSEREKFLVKFEDKNFYIIKNGKVVNKIQHLPQHIYFKEITDGLNPVVFLPDGTTEMAGHIILGIENKNDEKKIVVNNITGKCIIK
ncbi:MAG TPA: prepilin-type N-terminal cleavage/methylation domain-containing protein [bacterium]|nr:prepilin-type N-terminal cleavage/methylation domain-containing protein [bacterium]